MTTDPAPRTPGFEPRLGNAYVTGQTASTNFPTSPGAYDTTHNGGSDALVAKLALSESALVCANPLENARRVTLGQPFTGTGASETIVGTEGNDTINGRAGNDALFGEGGDDTLLGGAGNDALDGGTHTTGDTCEGQADTDTATNCERTSTVP